LSSVELNTDIGRSATTPTQYHGMARRRKLDLFCGKPCQIPDRVVIVCKSTTHTMKTTYPSLTVNALLAQAIRTVTPSWIDEHCEVRTFNSLRRVTVASTPDGSLSYCLAICCDEDCPEPGAHVGLIAELIGPHGESLAQDSIWGIQEPDDYSSPNLQAYVQHLAQLAAEMLTEITDADRIRKQLERRADEIRHTLALL